MGSSYWFKIALGALAVFGVGMVIAQVVEDGTSEIETQIASHMDGARVIARIPEQLEPLAIDGLEAGRVTRIQIDPDDDMTITLAADSAATARIRACGALVGTIDDLFDSGVECRSTDSLAGLGSFGHLQVAGTEVRVPLYATHAEVAEFHADGHDTSLDLRADSAGEAVVRITDDAGQDRVNIMADSGGAFIEIRGDDGRTIFRLKADSTGLNVNARDSN